MICNELYDDQGLGNQLWNYVVTRIIAKRNSSDFSILKKERFKGKDFMNLDFGTPLQGGITSKRGYLFTLPNGITSYYKERRELFGTTTVLSDMTDDISRTDLHLLTVPSNTKIEGNCQSTKYLEGNKENILNWLTIKDEYRQYKTEPNVCVIHLRTGDFMQSKAFLPIEYYQQAMGHIKSIDSTIIFQCVTDQKEMAEILLPGVQVIGSAASIDTDRNNAPHHHGGPIGIDFSLLMNARYLIIPNSSFSWWAAYLNTTNKIIVAPKYWARFNIADGFWSPFDIITYGFTYLDKQGNVFSSEQCWEEKNAFEKKHENMFNADNELNKSWKKHRFLIMAYVAFIIKKLPTLHKHIFK
ncbi:MAG: alpha-1,2-fucosyltransferase [Candidatus Paceibacterota bacterium]